MRLFQIIILTLSPLLVSITKAHILELLPIRPQESFTLQLKWQTDLWTDPDLNKTSPFRIYEAIVDIPYPAKNDQFVFLNSQVEGFSSGRADLVVGRNRVLIGSDLRTQDTGLGYFKKGVHSSWFSIEAAYKSDSDAPFKNSGMIWIETTAIYALPTSSDWQWILLLNYSKNRGYLNNRPIPLLGVKYPFGPDWQMTVGLPFLDLEYKSDPWWAHFVAVPTGTRLEAEKALNHTFLFNTRCGYTSRSYLHERREVDDDRLFFEEKFISVGFQTKVSEEARIEFNVGYSYDRNFYEAKQVFIPAGPRTRLDQDYFGHVYLKVAL